MSEVFRARVWCVDNDIDSDLILPIDVLPMPRLERPQHMFRANRPGWAAQVRQGDILIAGKNFGMGSGQPASLVMKDLGLACVVNRFAQRPVLSHLRQLRAARARDRWRAHAVRRRR